MIIESRWLGLARQIEQVIFVSQQVLHAVAIAHVGDIDLNLVFDAVEIKQIAAVIGNKTIDERNLRSQGGEPAREVGTDEAQPARNQNAGSLESIGHGFYLDAHARLNGIVRSIIAAALPRRQFVRKPVVWP